MKINSLLNRDGNNICADCSGSPVSALSVNLGVFICSRCEVTHEEFLRQHISSLLPADSIRMEEEGSWVHFSGARVLINYLQVFGGNERGIRFWEKKIRKKKEGEEGEGGNLGRERERWAGGAMEGVGVGGGEEEYPEDVKPTYASDLMARKGWLQAKYVEGRYCGVFGCEVVVKMKGKVGRYSLRMREGEFELSGGGVVERVRLGEGTVRPYVGGEGGGVEWFELVTRSGQVFFFFFFLLISLFKNLWVIHIP